MPAIGVADPLVSDDAFSSDSHHSFPSASLGLNGRSVRIGDETDREDLLSEINAGLLSTEREAEVAVGRKRSAVTLAALAQARVGVNKRAEAIAAARDCLDEVTIAGDGNEFDRTSARIAINVLLEYGEIDAVIEFSSGSPLGDYSKLELASALAESGRTDEARELAGCSQSSLRPAVLGYIELVDGKFAAAVPQLREALRRSPSDGSSAFNLSVALERLGSPQKALRAALQARASDPSRLDYSLHLIELLFAKKDLDAAASELSRWGKGADSIARVLVAKARLRLMKNQPEPALALLDKAQEIASKEEDLGLFAEIRSNLLKMRASRGSISRADALEGLAQLHERVPASDAVVANWAQVASRRSDSAPLLRAVEAVVGGASDARRMFLQYQMCTLNGDNAGASFWASEWLRVEPDNSRARAAYLVALGIGEARWGEARLVALAVLKDRELADSATLNNAAYVLAMSGHSDAAIDLIEPLSAKGSVFQATLGLALIAAGDVTKGMKMYRLAADAVEKVDSATRSLMTAYQALIIRQLDLDRTDGARVRALALPTVPLPDDWEDRPEFLRLAGLSKIQGYSWPMVVG